MAIPLVLGASALLVAMPLPAHAAGDAPDAGRQRALVRMVRQDCGSCHGLRLTGGLGPALTPDAVGALPLESLEAVIYNGRPGTAMPGWSAMLSAPEAHWIAEQLQRGFPEEKEQP